jgi:hypothetical protein
MAKAKADRGLTRMNMNVWISNSRFSPDLRSSALISGKEVVLCHLPFVSVLERAP